MARICRIMRPRIGEVDIHATAQGRVIPAGKTKTVAPPESGTVAAIRVHDGDHVSKGQFGDPIR